MASELNSASPPPADTTPPPPPPTADEASVPVSEKNSDSPLDKPLAGGEENLDLEAENDPEPALKGEGLGDHGGVPASEVEAVNPSLVDKGESLGDGEKGPVSETGVLPDESGANPSLVDRDVGFDAADKDSVSTPDAVPDETVVKLSLMGKGDALEYAVQTSGSKSGVVADGPALTPSLDKGDAPVDGEEGPASETEVLPSETVVTADSVDKGDALDDGEKGSGSEIGGSVNGTEDSFNSGHALDDGEKDSSSKIGGSVGETEESPPLVAKGDTADDGEKGPTTETEILPDEKVVSSLTVDKVDALDDGSKDPASDEGDVLTQEMPVESNLEVRPEVEAGNTVLDVEQEVPKEDNVQRGVPELDNPTGVPVEDSAEKVVATDAEEALASPLVEPQSAEADNNGSLGDADTTQNLVIEQSKTFGSNGEVGKNASLDRLPASVDSGLTSEVSEVDIGGDTCASFPLSAENQKTVADAEHAPADEKVLPAEAVGTDKSSVKELELLASVGVDNGDVSSEEKMEPYGSVEVQNRGTAETSTSADNGDDEPIADGDASVTKVNEVNGEANSVSEGPARVAILGSSETAKQILKDLGDGSPSTSSGAGSSRAFSPQMEGQIVSDSDEDVDTDEEGDGKELFDSAALAALLRAATSASSDGNATITASDAARIFSVDRPAGLGSSMPSLKPGPARSMRASLFSPSDVAVVGEDENNMDEEEKKLHDKVEQIRVKFLRLVHRLGHSAEDTVAAQVLYRLGLAEGIKRGRQINRAFSLESAKKKALQLEESGQEDLEFSCNILVLGKSGVGKSETINSIFGERVANTNAFQHATSGVKEIVGIVDGVKVRFVDTPGLTPSVMDQSSNKKILSSIKKYTKRCPPDIVLYVDRLDTQTRDFNDLPLLRSITSTLGSSIWFNAIVALTHAASAPPDGPNGTALGYDVFVAQRSHVVQHSIRQAAGDMRLMNPVALVENHPSCRRNREGQRVLPNGITWRPQLLLLCYSSKTLSEANSLLKLQDQSPGKLFNFRTRSPPLPYLLSSLLQSRPHPKLSTDQGDNDSDIDLGDLSDSDHEEEDEYNQLPPFKPLKKSQIEKLNKEQKNSYFDEYDYRVKLLQKKQWKEEVRRMKEMKKRGKGSQTDAGFGEIGDDYEQDGAPAAVPVPLPDMVLPPTFDCENSAYRYRFLEPTSQLLTRPVLDSHGWDHDCGYDGVSLEENLALAGRFPAGMAVQITKDKKEFNIHMDSSIAAKHGENDSTLAGFDIQSIGKQLAYILRGETKFKNLKMNKTAAGVSVTFLGENIATGFKVEDQMMIGNRLGLVATTGAIRSQGDMAYGANLEAKLREKDYPIGQDLSTLGLSLMKWRGDLALGANLQSQFSVGRNSKVAVRVGLNNKLTGQISVKTSTSEQLQIALLGILPIAISIFRSIWPGEFVQ